MQRPTSVSVFGILNLVFACFGVLGIFGSIAMFYMPNNSNNPVIKIMQDNPAYATFLKVSIPLGILSSGAMLAAGIGLLMMKNWGRLLSIGYAVYGIVFSLIGTVVNFVFVVRPLLDKASQQQGPEAAGAIGEQLVALLEAAFGLIYPILLLIFMTRPKLVAAFQAAESQSGGGLPPG